MTESLEPSTFRLTPWRFEALASTCRRASDSSRPRLRDEDPRLALRRLIPRAEAAGSSQRPALIVLHGFMGSPQDWIPVAAELPAFDVVGGVTPSVLEEILLDPACKPRVLEAVRAPTGAIEVAADALARALAPIDQRPLHLAGYSMGARIALAVCARHPELPVRSLTLVGGNPGISDLDERLRRLRWDLDQATRLQTLGTARFLSHWYDLALFSSLAFRPALRAELIASRTARDAGALARDIVAYSPARMDDYWLALPKLRVPTLFVAGALDEKYKALMRRAAELVPRGSYSVIESAGHTVLAESPRALAALVAEIVSRHTH